MIFRRYIYLLFSLLIISSNVVAQSSLTKIGYSPQIKLGDSYKWNYNGSTSFLDDDRSIFVSNNTLIQIDVIKDPSQLNFLDDAILNSLSDTFNITINGSKVGLDVLFTFIIAKNMQSSDGSTINGFDLLMKKGNNDKTVLNWSRTVVNGEYIDYQSSNNVVLGVFDEQTKIYDYESGILKKWFARNTFYNFDLILIESLSDDKQNDNNSSLPITLFAGLILIAVFTTAIIYHRIK